MDNTVQITTPIPSELHGNWRSRAAGWLLSIGRETFTLYDVTEAVCLKNRDVPLQLAELYDRYHLTPDGQTAHFYEPHKQTFEQFERTDSLIAATARSADPVHNFDAFAAYFAENYPFFEQHNIDWSKRVAAARPRVSTDTDDKALFAIFGSMLAGLNDGHVRLAGEVDGAWREIVPYAGRTLAAAAKVDAADSHESSWLNRYRANVMAVLLRGEGAYTGNRRIAYGWLDDEQTIGYLNIVLFEGLADSAEASWTDEIEAAHAAMSEVFHTLGDAQTLVVDVTNNRGGISVVAETIAGYFTSYPVAVGAVQRVADPRSPWQQLILQPSSATPFEKPVYLLTSDVTVSGGERFTLWLRALPHVTHLGERTRGSLSKILPKHLPNGWWLWLSSQAIFDHTGNLWEGSGIPPDTILSVFDPNELDDSHPRAVQRIDRAFAV